MIERSPGQGRYAVTEREQRWLLGRVPEGVSDPVEILDKYLGVSTLRLRRAQSGDSIVYKLGQKVRPDPNHPAVNQMTNMYLSEPEFLMLGEVDGATLAKTRWRWTARQSAFSVDEFGGVLRGLVLAEAELPVDGADPPSPPGALADVTGDNRFSGGHLASLTQPEAEDLLSAVALLREDRRQN
jgi:CYTH domain-containing protein